MALDADMRRRIRAHTAEGAEERKNNAPAGGKLDWSRVGFSADTSRAGLKKKTAIAWPLLLFLGYYGCVSSTSSSLDRSIERSKEHRAEVAERKRRANNPWLLDESAKDSAQKIPAKNAR
ncbi:hypothetical protein [Altererythrobacter sp. ZODW24]|uniref:hypothetical protein n=1 Tax=Altererythrobacter sp. ZODW24 TaxID=2185142 RepID=UPI000DF8681C|nr:hypothetical protein [Altererythrobacter sp. ZODW24]